MTEAPKPYKRSINWWLWPAIGFIGLWIFIFLTLSSDSNKNMKVLQNAQASSNAIRAANTIVNPLLPDWDNVNTGGVRVFFDEISDTSIYVVDKENYTTYTIRENQVFAPDKSAVKISAVDRLMQIKNSLNKRYKDGTIGIYRNTDMAGTKNTVKTLGNDRAEAVKSWFRINGMNQEYISIHSLAEQLPAESMVSSTGEEVPAGQIPARNLEIVVFPEKTIQR